MTPPRIVSRVATVCSFVCISFVCISFYDLVLRLLGVFKTKIGNFNHFMQTILYQFLLWYSSAHLQSAVAHVQVTRIT